MSGAPSPCPREALRRDGFVVLRSVPEACEALRAQPASALAALVGESPVHVDCVDVTPVPGRASIVESDRDGRLHVDAFPLASPDLVVMSCDQQAPHGGESELVDVWPLLGALARQGHPGLAELFLRYRSFRFPAYQVFAPTVSLRNGRLACQHATFPQAGDTLGEWFQSVVDRAPRIRFRLEAGDVYLIDNHRMLHGRTRFQGPRRLQRLQAWMPSPPPAPSAWVEAARMAGDWHRGAAAALPLHLHRRLGLAPVPEADLARIPSRVDDAALAGFVQALPTPPRPLVEQLVALVGQGLAA